MYKKVDKIRAHREVLKSLWFHLDHTNIPVKKQIIVTMDKYPARLGYADIEFLDDGPNGYHSFKTLQENPFLYVSESKEFNSGEYELIVIE